ncbi:MAG: methionyl-tRNA formyltransferase [Spirochaetia bacterium]|nr:methionyl-tRNA formyltransferase [Spirochaetia bacterium]
MRILFAGTPLIAVPSLQAAASQFDVPAVLTNPDRPQGRHHTLVPSPVKEKAVGLGIDVLQPERLRGAVLEQVASYGCDVLICFAYGKIFGKKMLSLFPRGCYNIHPSLLPAYRGAAPIQYAILHGERQTGISIQQMSLGVDEGDLASVQLVGLDGSETTESLTQKVSDLAAGQLVSFLKDLEKGPVALRPQQGEPSYTAMLEKEQAPVDWTASAWSLHCKVRAFYPWPKAVAVYDDKQLAITGVHFPFEEEPCPEVIPGTVVKVDKEKGIGIACGDGLLYVDRLQLAGKKEMDFRAFVNGNPSIRNAVLR